MTNHEPPELGTAYERSLKTIQSYPERFDLIIDLHRDAYSPVVYKALSVKAGGADAAQLMLLIGNGKGFDDDPRLLSQKHGVRPEADEPAQRDFARHLPGRDGQKRSLQPASGVFHFGGGRAQPQHPDGGAIASMPYLADAISQEFFREERIIPIQNILSSSRRSLFAQGCVAFRST